MKDPLTSFNYFDLSAVPFHQWQNELEKRKGGGASSVPLRILWGLHELGPGIRDFARTPRLRLERFLSLATELGLKIEVAIGFPPVLKALPDWVWGLPKNHIVPLALFRPGASVYQTTAIPSLAQIQEPFCEFLKELFAILRLYAGGEGGIARIEVDFGIYRFVSGGSYSGFLSEILAQRYDNIDHLNSCYQTNYTQFGSLDNPRSLGLLFSKRPWLACYDFKWVRQKALADLYLQLQTLAPASLRSLLVPLWEDSGSSAVSENWEVLVESALIESGPEGFLPFALQKELLEVNLQAYQYGDYISTYAANEGVGCVALPLWGRRPLRSSMAMVVCGSYMAQNSVNQIRDFCDGGGHVFFPFGLPQYDEYLNAYSWPLSYERRTSPDTDRMLMSAPWGQGKVSLPTPVFSSTKSDFPTWKRWMEEMVTW